jgi:large subunit ribosomal protein L20
MSRTKTGFVRRRWHKKILKHMRGQWGTRHRLHRRANEAMIKSFFYAFRDRRRRKRDMRRLWVIRINAAARLNGVSYSKLMYGLKNANVDIDRKMLADVAVRDPQTFTKIVALSLQNSTPSAKPQPVVRASAPKAAPPVAAAPKAAPAAAGTDDLLIIEGLGPKSVEALNNAGVTTFAQVASMSPEELDDIVRVKAGVRLLKGQVETWPKQAKFLLDGDMDGFKAYTDHLVGGREPGE